MTEKFFDYLRFEKRFSEHTLTAYSIDLKQFIVFADLTRFEDFKQITSSTIRSWIIALMEAKYSKKSINRKLATLRSIYKWMRKEGLTKENPLAKITGPKTEKRLPIFAKESEFDPKKTEVLFSNQFGGLRDELMFECFYQTGIRLSELVHLNLKDVNAQSIKVLGKRNKERIIPISKELYSKMHTYQQHRQHIAKTQAFFVLDNGKALYPAFVYRKINGILNSLTHLDKCSPHILRHTFATHMLNRGAGLETLKDLLGHSSLAATQVYTHNSFAQLTKIYSSAHPRTHIKS